MSDGKPFFRCPVVLDPQPDGRVYANVTLRDGRIMRIEVPADFELYARLEAVQREGQDVLTVTYGPRPLRPLTA
jgi:hypothetical protein